MQPFKGCMFSTLTTPSSSASVALHIEKPCIHNLTWWLVMTALDGQVVMNPNITFRHILGFYQANTYRVNPNYLQIRMSCRQSAFTNKEK